MPSTSSKKPKSEKGPPYASLALALMKQKWSKLSTSEDPLICATPDLDVLVDRVTALLVVRIAAMVSSPGTFPDSSTTMICTTVIGKKKAAWPKGITPEALEQLKAFVQKILSLYKEVPYHNREHAYHVVLSSSKLLDMMCCCYTNMDGEKDEAPTKFKPPPSFGLRNNPMAQFALVFAALIHDVEHQGLANRQLASENDKLAVLYNDQSIAENWSLYIAFSELLQDEFFELRRVLFGEETEKGAYSEKYHSFRKMVVGLVLGTDLASPERTQVGKSKWKEAFGEPHETVEAKLKDKLRRISFESEVKHESKQPQDGEDKSDDEGTAQQLFMPTRRWGQDTTTTRPELSSSLRSSSASVEPFNANSNHNQRMLSLNDDFEDSASGTPDVSLNGDESGRDVFDTSLHTAPPIFAANDPRRPSGRPSLTRGELSTSNHELQLPSSDKSNSGKGMKSLNDFLTRSQSTRFASRVSRDGHRGRFLRTGILRTIDLGGETLETYSRHDKVSSAQSTVAFTVADEEADEPDELKMTVVMEAILASADIAHNLQSWDHMIVWSRRLYFELRRAHAAGRGIDVSPNWFENQIGFLESYVLPLARRLEDTGVWGDEDSKPGFFFSQTVEEIRDEWFTDGYEFTKELIEQGDQIFANS